MSLNQDGSKEKSLEETMPISTRDESSGECCFSSVIHQASVKETRFVVTNPKLIPESWSLQSAAAGSATDLFYTLMCLRLLVVTSIKISALHIFIMLR